MKVHYRWTDYYEYDEFLHQLVDGLLYQLIIPFFTVFHGKFHMS